MNIKQVTRVYFSPTDNTRTVVELIAGQLPFRQEKLDLTDAGQRPEYHCRSMEDGYRRQLLND